jgi:alpha/beta superfamily hydrolase/acyl carrier protein
VDWSKLGQHLGESPPLLQNLIQGVRLPQSITSGEAVTASGQAPNRTGQSIISSGTDLEELIAGVWRDVLGVEQISSYDNFFNLGGDSLMSIQALAQLEQKTGVKVPVAYLGYQTLGQLAAIYKAQLSSQQPVSADPPSPGHNGDNHVSLSDAAVPEPVNVNRKSAVNTLPLPFYFGASSQRLFGCYHTPSPGTERSCAVVLCYPFGSEYIRSHRAYQQLAGRLARAGFPTLRFDFFGCGDSEGEGEEGQFDQWLKNIAVAVAEVQERSGLQQVCLAGLRLGASLAMLAGAVQDNISKMVLWEPVIQGKEYLQELTTQHQETIWRFFVQPKTYKVSDRPTELLGFPLNETLIDDLEKLDLLTISQKPAQNVLIIENRETAIAEPLKMHLSKLKTQVIHQHLPTFKIWVEDPDKGLVPQPTLQTIISWISEVSP